MLEILKYCLPGLLVLAATWLVLHNMLQAEDKKYLWEAKKQSQKETSQTRLRAYERLSLLLERTVPEHMLRDLNLSEMTPMQVQQQLISTIRLEFDHNLSQQIYVSDELWRLVMDAQQQTIAFITSVAIQMPPASSALDYAKMLITAYSTNGETATEKALAQLKNEARTLL